MKNTQGEQYNFALIAPHTYTLVGEPTLLTILKNNRLVVGDEPQVTTVNYSGSLVLGIGNTIEGQTIKEINVVNNRVEYVIVQ